MSGNKIEYVKLSTLKPNPDNPRVIKDEAFFKLVDNLLQYSKMIPVRPIVKKDGLIYAGNMRFRAIQHILKLEETEFLQIVNDKFKLDIDDIDIWQQVRKTKSVPSSWVADAGNFTQKELDALVILDNVQYGEHDWDKLANKWEPLQLADFGLVIPNFASNKHNDMLETEKVSVSFEANKKMGATDDDYAVYDVLLHKADKKTVTDLMDTVKSEINTDKLSEAFMHIVHYYIKNKI